ncbi:MAG TPA: hypothetical protein VLG67_04370 [Candidatus Saccharimonadales bacterium]|nr:hypothetical protein [Candidatus Saccharimonadales bacterium]
MKKLDPYKPLDKYEEKLGKAIENDEFVSVPNAKKEIKRYTSYARAMLRKNKRLTIRIDDKDLEDIQQKAIKSGIPYQTLLGSLIHQFAKDEISLKL